MLSETKIKAARPRKKPYKLADGRGLYLFITPPGGRLWRLDYRIHGKRKTLSLGAYPDIPLKSARNRLNDARRKIADGIDPSIVRKAEKAAGNGGSFKAVALEWHAKQSARWDPDHARRVQWRLERYVFPWLGGTPVKVITAPEILSLLRGIESRGAAETAHRVHQVISQVMRYAVATGRAEHDPAGDLKGALQSVKTTNRAAITHPNEVGELLRAMEGYSGSLVTRCALRLAPYVFVRPGELRRMEWTEIDLDTATWRIPAVKMKMREEHIVPLSKQAIAILQEVRPLTGNGRYVFPSERTRERPISENTLNAALRRLGYSKEEMTSHGFRAMAATFLNEKGWPKDVIERQLAHAERNKVRAAYNRAEHLPERRRMMQAYADYLDSLRAGADVVSIRKGA